ncbi:Cation-transporting ATPase, E1-E2 family [Pseudonocardia sp. Ae168_Ps1]|uniref:HAD-IC family P-type ATPase n=1 Tax=unclassified Pseudonocardia TaxID=2619320 RepID=UPI00094ACA9A|nr:MULTISPECIES: HAD-IC family P-type ATPase [unclassified Pseudonocardia]OLL72208.1 Cation-transporting ATPase, E1-E2 family [Pseudonocardia sp. Ae150A_Ps1]OLL78177.1 Cation-transporting ATPase, E1-E2 family [Pseudonocardia sp. Ae168_Ps1]OLL87701.1 Cation-transporting ATPase, E1-E2 family [Pseudonocardia sp. Ae263_Ps1]OLL92272.1 Cation-transporting ATPase, E1-E2 family [Pseudonocardia sp. Ae356_Ps1]
MTAGILEAPPEHGLTAGQVAAQRRAGLVNAPVSGGLRTYATILRTNVFSFYNSILFAIGAILLVLGRYNDALVSVGLGLINAVIGAVQEIRAKRKLDNLQLLDEAGVTVVRDGTEQRVAGTDVVAGDVLLVRAGDQIVVDGPVLTGRAEADESLLTGESDPVVKETGDVLRSGSHCVAGEARQRAEAVGAGSYAGRLTLDARRATTDATPLQRRIDFVVRLTMALVVLMSGAILAQAFLEGFSLLRVVQITAVLSGLVPYGLFFLIAVAYTRGAARIARKGALVQQVNAVESVTHVDVVCTDKTGTLTTGRLRLKETEPLAGTDPDPVLARYAAAVSDPNLTSAALAAALPGEPWELRDEVPFTSAQRWSGQVTDDGAWVLGAPDALAPHLTTALPDGAVDGRTALGLRVLLLARAADPAAGLRRDGRPALPRLEPVALVALADELRPEVVESVARFAGSGVAIKVLSGDDPRTVAALAVQAGLDAGDPVTGPSLDALDDAELDRLVARTTVFGRVAPEQKERIVAALRRCGGYVAMLGDGVNDARALKGAHVGVAMRSGSPVTRDVADIVLVDDSFSALLPARAEGRRIIDGIAVSMYVFLARVATQGLVIAIVAMLGLGFPYSPTQVGLTLLTVGVPTFFLTIWAREDEPDPDLLGNLARFVVPASVVTASIGAIVYTTLHQAILQGLTSGRTPDQVVQAFQSYTGLTYGRDADFAEAAATIGAQTGLSTFVSLASFVLILFLRPPHRIFAAWTAPVADRRPAWLVLALTAAFAGVVFTPVLSTYFGLTGAARPVFSVVVPSLLTWFVLLWLAFRYRALDRILGIDRLPGRR